MEFLKSRFKKSNKVKGSSGKEANKVNNDKVFREAMEYSVKAEQAFKKGDLKTASEFCLQAIKLNKKLEKLKTPTPYERIAVILSKQGKVKEALNYINEYLTYEPQNIKFLQYKERFTQKLNTQVVK